MISSGYVHVLAGALFAVLLGCAHLPAGDQASDQASAQASARSASQPLAAGNASPPTAAQGGTAGGIGEASAAAAGGTTGASTGHASAAAAARAGASTGHAPTAAAGGVAAGTPTVVVSAYDPHILRQAFSLGFHLEKVAGRTYLCREEEALGSHFDKRECYDQENMKILLQQVFQTQDVIRAEVTGGSPPSMKSH
jgi:hypothetical protein